LKSQYAIADSLPVAATLAGAGRARKAAVEDLRETSTVAALRP
jgi:hypothetical protein